MRNKHVGGSIYPARPGNSDGGLAIKDRHESIPLAPAKITPTANKTPVNTWKLYFIIWMIIIGGVALTFINNPTLQFVGATVWLVGVLLQLIFGVYFIIKFRRRGNKAS